MSFCIECDAPEGRCECNAVRYYDVMVCERVTGAGGREVGYRIPDEWRYLWDNPGTVRFPSAAREPSPDPDHNPFKCRGCGAPLNAFARRHGFTYCQAKCRQPQTDSLPF